LLSTAIFAGRNKPPDLKLQTPYRPGFVRAFSGQRVALSRICHTNQLQHVKSRERAAFLSAEAAERVQLFVVIKPGEVAGFHQPIPRRGSFGTKVLESPPHTRAAVFSFGPDRIGAFATGMEEAQGPIRDVLRHRSYSFLANFVKDGIDAASLTVIGPHSKGH
jgi:hypothetical protein